MFGLDYPVDVEVDHDRLLATAGHHAFQRLVVEGVDLLVRHERRYEDEPARAGFVGEFEVRAPPHPGLAADHVDHGLQLAVMVRPGLRAGVDRESPGPQLLRARPVMGDRGRAGHPWCLRGVGVQRVARDDPHALGAPIPCYARFNWAHALRLVREAVARNHTDRAPGWSGSGQTSTGTALCSGRTAELNVRERRGPGAGPGSAPDEDVRSEGAPAP